MMLMAQWLEKLVALDKQLFIFLNTKATAPLLDSFFPIWRDSSTWIPFYILLLVLMIWKFRSTSLWWILMLVITVVISDQISSGILKNWVGRLRPCNDPDMIGIAKLLLARCPSSGSFTSSHATNHFAMATFLFITLKPYLQRNVWWLMVWAASISYGQVYVGVHYPLDIFCGFILGILIGKFTTTLYQKKLPQLLLQPKKH